MTRISIKWNSSSFRLQENKREAEQKQIALIREHVDFTVLARYASAVERVRRDLSASHHQHPPLLPAGVRGREPYPKASGAGETHQRPCYVTSTDDGPIIEQTWCVSHRDSLKIDPEGATWKGRTARRALASTIASAYVGRRSF
jgi:formyltetrahydrofolate hydrolase